MLESIAKILSYLNQLAFLAILVGFGLALLDGHFILALCAFLLCILSLAFFIRKGNASGLAKPLGAPIPDLALLYVVYLAWEQSDSSPLLWCCLAAVLEDLVYCLFIRWSKLPKASSKFQ
ncbi:MAG: hypothetical protein LUD17_16125 [Bacteroidales bacterium]|nr:hypothetical protein [Bacteroidales bacterium]